jgi:hypothetical protein
MAFIPMKFCESYRTIFQSNFSNSLPFSPGGLSINAIQPPQLTNTATRCDCFNPLDFTKNLEVHIFIWLSLAQWWKSAVAVSHPLERFVRRSLYFLPGPFLLSRTKNNAWIHPRVILGRRRIKRVFPNYVPFRGKHVCNLVREIEDLVESRLNAFLTWPWNHRTYRVRIAQLIFLCEALQLFLSNC